LSNPKKTLLVVEDDPGLQKALRWAFSDFEVVTAEDRNSAIAQLRRHEPPVVTLDLGLPPEPGSATEGLATLQEILSLAPDTKVIVVTGNNDRENAVRAIGLGAWLFFQKPVDAELLSFIVERAYTLYQLEQENRALSRDHRDQPADAGDLPDGREGGADRCHHPAAGGERDRQGTAGARPACPKPPCQGPVCGHQLRRHPGYPAGERAVRL
jgi:DNA-binding NtrC family response regulator